jgi:hypothetical protein
LYAGFSFPSQEVSTPAGPHRKIMIPAENVIARSAIMVIIKDPYSIIDIINDF